MLKMLPTPFAWLVLVVGVAAVAYGLAMAVLYPAGGFFLVWIVAGVLLGWAGLALATRWAYAVAVLAVAAVLGLGCALIWRDAAATPPDDLDYLVVLGASLKADGSPKETLANRLDAAAAYLDENPGTRCVLSGGQGTDEPQTEASAMAAYLRNRGVDDGRLVLEERSTTTAENLRFSREAIEGDAAARGAASWDSAVQDVTVGVVTNDFHVFRALRLARGQGFAQVWGVAAPTNALYLPQALARECFAVAKDALVGNLSL